MRSRRGCKAVAASRERGSTHVCECDRVGKRLLPPCYSAPPPSGAFSVERGWAASVALSALPPLVLTLLTGPTNPATRPPRGGVLCSYVRVAKIRATFPKVTQSLTCNFLDFPAHRSLLLASLWSRIFNIRIAAS